MQSTDSAICFNLLQIKEDLLSATSKCQIRGLYYSTAWLSELLLSVNDELKDESKEINLSTTLAYEFETFTPDNFINYTLSKAFFDLKEFSRCSHHLSTLCNIKSRNPPNPILYFIYAYSRYMAIEKNRTDNSLAERKQWNWTSGADTSANYETYRKEMSDLKTDIEHMLTKSNRFENEKICSMLGNNCDVYIMYVYALVRIRLGYGAMAIQILTYIVKKDPTMWPAWSELVFLLEDREQLDRIFPLSVSDSKQWMSEFFRAKTLLKLQEAERALVILQTLSANGFKKSLNLQADIAEAYDRLRDLDSAVEQFKQLFLQDPYRLKDTDVYSNVLFVKGEQNELAFLARRCAKIDKYRPETCCVLGNFYGLRGQHDKAVLYFQRALRLQPRYALVWTLIGHEYVELRHLKLATHAYNQAILHNRQDHRAWYGLGQLYEFVKQLDHALYYYKRAQYLCPTDSRIIVALGEMYEALGNLNAAKKCFWRAYSVGDLEGGALNNLAKCFDKTGEESEAAAAYTQFIQQCNSRGVTVESELGQAYRYLANYHFRHGHYNDAVIAVNKCLDFPEIREEAKALCLQLTLLSGSASQMPQKSVTVDMLAQNMEEANEVNTEADGNNSLVKEDDEQL